MLSPVFLVAATVGDGEQEAYDLVCRTCDGQSRLHPGEGFVGQVRVFLDQHRAHGTAQDAAGQ